jgi:flagellar basal body-associated protein FliL
MFFSKKKKKKNKSKRKEEIKNVDYYYRHIDPIVEDTLTYEQKVEVRKVISLSMPKEESNVTHLSFRVWLKEFYRVNLSIIEEKSNKELDSRFGGIWGIAFIVMMSILLLFVALGVLVLVFVLLYYFKVMTGIDFLEGHIIQPHFFDQDMYTP